MDSDDSQPMENLGNASAKPNQSEKKRNRKSDEKTEITKKKKKQIVKATIQVLNERPDQAPPIVGYFPSGFNPESFGSTSARVFRHATRPKRLQLVVTPNGSKVDFVGTNHSGEAECSQQHCNYALGVLDKETQTLKIVPISSNKIFRLEPKVRGVELQEKEPKNSEDVDSTVSSHENIAKLNAAFGTKKSIRNAKRQEELRKEEDPITKKDINEKLKQLGVKAELEDPESSQIALDRNVPPYNSEATSPQQAYPLNKIIFDGDSEFLEDVYDELQKEAKASWDYYPSFISNRIKRLQEITDEEAKKRLAMIFSFISHLVKFKDSHSMDGVASSKKGPRIPPILQQRFSRLFEEELSSRRLSDQKKDLLMYYVMVLTLHADNFQTNVADISKDLKLNSLAAREYYSQLGCKFVRQERFASSLATLPVPLNFPGIKRKRSNK